MAMMANRMTIPMPSPPPPFFFGLSLFPFHPLVDRGSWGGVVALGPGAGGWALGW